MTPAPEDGFDRASSLVGQTIHDRYEVVRELGQGSLGRVFLAKDRAREGEAIALKVVRADRVSAEALSYLKGEFVNLARLRHPNVARVYDLDRLPGRQELFFTEEFLDGPDFVEATWKKPIGVFLDLFVQALRALAYVHARGLLHADVKPRNIFICSGVVKLVDFHLARELGGAFDRSLRGTIAYMAPEVVRGERPDARADLYSLGVVAYEALAGDLPFAGRSAMEMLRAHASEKVPPLREAGANLPPPLEAVVLRLLEKAPDARFRGANDVIRALNAGLGRRDAIETAETRESYILSPRFVGREKELAILLDAARATRRWDVGATHPNPPPASRGEGVLLSYDGIADASTIEPLESPISLSEESRPQGATPSRRVEVSRTVFLVRGPDGIGKTRLLKEFRVHCQVEGIPVHEAAARGPGARLYEPFLEVLAAVLRREGETELLANLQGADGRLDVEKIAGSPSPDESLRGARFRRTAALGTLLVERSQRQPFAILVESAESLDEGSAELARYLAADVTSRALCVLAARDDGEGTPLDGIGVLARGAEVALERLPLQGTAELLASMLAVEQVPEDFARRVQEATGGNPRFVEESVRSLSETRAIAVREGVLQVSADALARLPAPRGVVEVAARRVERLDPEARLLLAAFAASPHPRPLSFALNVTGLEREAGERVLAELTRRGLLEIREGAYAIDATPVREAALEALPPGREAAIHLACARLLETRHPSAARPDARASSSDARGALAEAPRDRAEDLLHHLAQAGEAQRAYRYALEAAETARARFEPERARRLYERALQLASEAEGARAPGELALAKARLGEARLQLGDRRAAAIALHEAAEDPRAPARVVAFARRLDATLKKGLGAYERSERALDAAAAAARIAAAEGDVEGERELARIRAERANVKLWRGQYRATLAEGQAALDAMEKLGLAEETAAVCQTLFHAAHFSGDDAGARAFLRRGLEAPGAQDPRSKLDESTSKTRASLGEDGARSIGDAGGAHVPLSTLGAALDRTGRAQDLERIYARQVELLEATRDLEGAALAHNNLANLQRLKGRYDLAIQGYRRALELHRALGGRPGVAVARLNLARAQAELGDPRGGAERAVRARATARACGAKWIEAQAELAIADAARRRGDLTGARAAIEAARAIVDEIGNAPLRVEADLTSAEIELDAAIDGSQDLATAERALDAFSALPMSTASALSVARANIVRSRVLVLRARQVTEGERGPILERALRVADEALAVSQALGTPELVWRAARARAAARAGRGELQPALENLVLAMDTLRGVARDLPRDLRAIYLQEPSRLEVREAWKQLER